jgi:hypothetical protein
VCMQCHNPTAPGHVMTSTVPDETGMPLFHAGSFVTSDRSPLEERWGGWYVTGNHGIASDGIHPRWSACQCLDRIDIRSRNSDPPSERSAVQKDSPRTIRQHVVSLL